MFIFEQNLKALQLTFSYTATEKVSTSYVKHPGVEMKVQQLTYINNMTFLPLFIKSVNYVLHVASAESTDQPLAEA